MTPYEAKELTLELWRYLADHPELGSKFYLPDNIYNKIKTFFNKCPLCELFFNSDGICFGCPLQDCAEGSLYDSWSHAGAYVVLYKNKIAIRKEAAQGIVDIVQVWEPEIEVARLNNEAFL
jgi:hypothetical protein